MANISNGDSFLLQLCNYPMSSQCSVTSADINILKMSPAEMTKHQPDTRCSQA